MSTGRRVRIGAMLAAFGVLGLWTGCSSKKQTELVAGVSTQVRVPKDLKAIRIDVATSGVLRFCNVYPVVNGRARLPRTLGLAAGPDPNQPVTITVTGYSLSPDDPTFPQDVNDCLSAPRVKPLSTAQNPKPEGTARVLRRSRQPYVESRVLFLPMPLKFSCFEKDCAGADGQSDYTCKAGKCVPPDNTATLVDYNENQILGNSNTCFSPSRCLTDAVPALPVPVDPKTCVFAIPGTANAPDAGVPVATSPEVANWPANGLNVRAYYDDGSFSEVLDYDKDEGFVPVEGKPGQFKLADGLCNPDPGGHRIVLLTASGACPSKTPLQPICDGESPSHSDLNDDAGASTMPVAAAGTCSVTPIVPAPSALLVLLDRSKNMKSFYGENGAQQVLALSLSDPSFQTTSVALQFFPRDPADATECGGANSFSKIVGKDVDFALALTNQTKIADLVKVDQSSPDLNPLHMDAALNSGGSEKLLNDFANKVGNSALNRKAILIITSDDVGAGLCSAGANLTAEAQALAANGVKTYVVNLPALPPAATPDAYASNARLITDGAGTALFDQAVNEVAGVDAFQTIVSDLASCVYDPPGQTCTNQMGNQVTCTGGILDVTARLTYLRKPVITAPPVTRAILPVAAAGGADPCSGIARGWVKDAKDRIRICGSDCGDLRDALRSAGELAALFGVASTGVPVSISTCGGGTPAVGGMPTPSMVDAGTGG